MELCAGDITKRDWITWNVFVKEGIDWCRFNTRRRYEWLEILNELFKADDPKKRKHCRNPQVCAMCRKRCRQREAPFQSH